MYKPPIEIASIPVENIVYNVRKYTDAMICQAVQEAGINVNKEELEKALRYDRAQYEKGYEDGFAEGKIAQIKEYTEAK